MRTFTIVLGILVASGVVWAGGRWAIERAHRSSAPEQAGAAAGERRQFGSGGRPAVVHPAASTPPSDQEIRCGDTARLEPSGDEDKDTEVLRALSANDLSQVQALLLMGARDPLGASDVRRKLLADQRRTVALYPAAAKGDVGELRRLIRAGADVNVNLGIDMFLTPLAWAAACDRADAVRLLLEAGARVDEPISFAIGSRAMMNSTALGWAVHMDSVEPVRLLLEAGADPNTVPWGWDFDCYHPGGTALDNAAEPIRSMLRTAGGRPSSDLELRGLPACIKEPPSKLRWRTEAVSAPR